MRTEGVQKSLLQVRTSLKDGLRDAINQRHLDRIRSNFRVTAESRYKVHSSFRDIFLFSNPSLYFGVVEHMLMVISAYCGLWITNFQYSISNSLRGEESILWQLYSALPGLLSICLFVMTVRSAAFLRAITTFDAECVHQTIEQSEQAKELGDNLRMSILNALGVKHNPDRATFEKEVEEIKAMFLEVHENEMLILTRLEFQLFLRKLGVDFSDKKWRKIFREIDRNHDDAVILRIAQFHANNL